MTDTTQVIQTLINQVQHLGAAMEEMKLQQQQQQPPQQVHQSSSQLKPPKPSTFHGDRRTVDTWLFEVDSYLSAFPNTTEENKLAFFVSCLRDTAIIWWQALKASRTEENQVKTCQQFKEEFKKHYQPLQAAETARTALYRLKQTGAVKTYIERFLLHVQYITKMDEDDKIFLFKQGLQAQIARDVSFQRPKTLFEAMEFASRSEADSRSYRVGSANQQQYSTYQNNYQPGVQSVGVPMDVSAIEDQSEEQEQYIHAVSGTNGNSRTEDRRCYSCQRVGHIVRNCPNRTRFNQRTSDAQNYPKGQRRQ